MSNDIKAGDLVMIVKPRECGCPGAIGTVFTVGEIRLVYAGCEVCGDYDENEIYAAIDFNDGASCNIKRLIKINPPSQDETITNQDEVTA